MERRHCDSLFKKHAFICESLSLENETQLNYMQLNFLKFESISDTFNLILTLYVWSKLKNDVIVLAYSAAP